MHSASLQMTRASRFICSWQGTGATRPCGWVASEEVSSEADQVHVASTPIAQEAVQVPRQSSGPGVHGMDSPQPLCRASYWWLRREDRGGPRREKNGRNEVRRQHMHSTLPQAPCAAW